MRIRSLLRGAVAGLTVVSLSVPAPATTILFSEAENSINGQEVLPSTTVTVTNEVTGQPIGGCPGVIVPPFTQPCVQRRLNRAESGVATLRVPSGTFLDPDATRPPGLPNAGPPHTAMAFLLERGGAISDVVTLEFFAGGQFGTGLGLFDDVELRSVSDSEASLGTIPNGFVFPTVETGAGAKSVRVLLHGSGEQLVPATRLLPIPALRGGCPDCRRATSCRPDLTHRKASSSPRRSGCSASDC